MLPRVNLNEYGESMLFTNLRMSLTGIVESVKMWICVVNRFVKPAARESYSEQTLTCGC